jgi:hypothetical protein
MGVFMQIKCACQSIAAINDSWNCILNHFEGIRKNCAALKEIFVPDSEWPNFRKMAPSSYDESGHRSTLLGALKRGELSKITLPVHRYLLVEEKPKDSLRKNYKKDFIEKWMLEETPLQRHRRVKEFNGKLAELITASWLESKGWEINNLEALDGSFDIEAISPREKNAAIEVKYIGEEDWQFEANLKSVISKKAVGGGFSVYNGYNYILFRVYEATKQLSSFKGDRYVFLVISHLTWGFLDIAIKDNWLQRYPSKFTDLASSRWNDFLSKQKEKKYPNIEKEINDILNQIKELWIIKSEAWKYSISKIITLES